MKNVDVFLFFLDSRPISSVVSSLQDSFDAVWEEDSESKALGNARFEMCALGVRLGFSREEAWDEGIVYRMAGGPHPFIRIATKGKVDLNFHVQALLEKAGCQRVMLFEEFRDESRRRGMR